MTKVINIRKKMTQKELSKILKIHNEMFLDLEKGELTCPECWNDIDRIEFMRMNYSTWFGTWVCRDCAMDGLRQNFEQNDETIEAYEEFYLECERSHYMNYLVDDFDFILKKKPTIFAEIWNDLEANLIWVNKSIWIDMLTYINENNICIMEEEDKKKWDELPNRFKIYRGSEYEDGLSWTLSREKAEWFKNRFSNPEAKVWERYAEKDDCVAYLNGRNEEEIIYLGMKK